MTRTDAPRARIAMTDLDAMTGMGDMQRNVFRTKRLLVMGAAICLGWAVPVHGQSAAGSGAPDEIEHLLRKMSDRIEALERNNQALQEEVVHLREVSGDDWLTEQRATQIRALVSDVLADADHRASLQSSGMTAGWNDGFFLSSPDGRFRLEIDGQMQFRYVYNYQNTTGPFDNTDRNRGGFENTRTRLTFRGHVFNNSLQYLVRGGFSRLGGGRDLPNDLLPRNTGEVEGGNFQLYDAWIRYQFDESWSVRAGQFKLPFSREELVSSANQLAIERSLVNESLNFGRSQGVEVAYRNDYLQAMLSFSDGVSDSLLGLDTLLGTRPANTPWSIKDTEYAFVGRLEFKPVGTWDQFKQFTSPVGEPFGLMLGTGVAWQRGEYPVGSVFAPDRSNELFAATVDLSVQFGGANLFAAATWAQPNATQFGRFDIFGVVVQGGIYLFPKWELFARFEYGFIDSDNDVVNVPDLGVVTMGVNWYIDGQDAKWSFDVGWGLDDISQFWASDIAGYRPDNQDAASQFVFRTQFQLLF